MSVAVRPLGQELRILGEGLCRWRYRYHNCAPQRLRIVGYNHLAKAARFAAESLTELM